MEGEKTPAAMSQKRTDHNEELFALGWLIDAAVAKLSADPDDVDSWRLVRWALRELERLDGGKVAPGTIEDLKAAVEESILTRS
jgi:hypothetical protein